MPGLIICAILFVLAAGFISFISSPKGKGMVGEWKVKKICQKTVLKPEYNVNNIIVTNDGKSSQIDHVVIRENAIFVIETKNYSGRIYGKDNQQEWTQVLRYGKVKNHFYNPVKQNATHVYQLKKVLPEGTPIVSVVVFVQNNTQYIEAQNVFNLAQLKKILIQGKPVLNAEKMDAAYQALTEAKESNHTSARQHVAGINKMLEEINENICPRCKGKLIKKNGKYGEFYGCENYPTCKFIKKG